MVPFITFRSHQFSGMDTVHFLPFLHQSHLDSLARWYACTSNPFLVWIPLHARTSFRFFHHSRSIVGSLSHMHALHLDIYRYPCGLESTLLIAYSSHYLFPAHCRFLVFILGIVCRSTNRGILRYVVITSVAVC